MDATSALAQFRCLSVGFNPSQDQARACYYIWLSSKGNPPVIKSVCDYQENTGLFSTRILRLPNCHMVVAAVQNVLPYNVFFPDT